MLHTIHFVQDYQEKVIEHLRATVAKCKGMGAKGRKGK